MRIRPLAQRDRARLHSMLMEAQVFTREETEVAMELTGNSPSGLRHPACGRFASPRMGPDKILILTQSVLFQSKKNPMKKVRRTE